MPRVTDLASDAREVHVLMNNCHRDYSVRNAREIGEMLGVFERSQRSEVRGPRSDEEGAGGEQRGQQSRLL